MLEFQSVTKTFAQQVILQEASFRINPGERVGVVGPNGAGKSTLFSLIIGQEETDKGDVIVPGGLRLGHLRQQLFAQENEESLLHYACSGLPELKTMEERIHQLQDEVAQAHDAEKTRLLSMLGDMEHEYEHLGGYDLKHRAEAALSGLGFQESDFSRPFSSFSGGWQMRAELTRTLISKPDILLLDEPSNYLDLPAVDWLQRFLKGFAGTLLLISHDRYLLQTLTELTLEVASGRATRYAGDYRYYLRERDARLVQAVAAWKNQQQKRAEIERFIERFRAKNTKASQVQSRVKMLEKMEVLEEPQASRQKTLIRIAPPPHSGMNMIRLDEVGMGYSENQWVLRGVSLTLERGDRAALIGYNGMGKTTLLRAMAGLLPIKEGQMQLGHDVVVGYQSQEFADTMPADDTALQIVRARKPSATEREARTLLGGFGFQGDAADKPCRVLSGGEKIRLAFARIFIAPPNLLVLDEPTTHLDLDGRCALEEALQQYTGTVVLVSHDIEFVRKTATRIIAMKPGGVECFDGDYAYYYEKRGGLSAPPPDTEQEQKKKSSKARGQERKALQSELRKCKKIVSESEARIEALDHEQEDLMAQLTPGGEEVDYKKINHRLEDIQKEILEAQEAWEAAALRVEEIEG